MEAGDPISFTEPNLAFRWGSGRSVEADFSYEALPPWLPGSGLRRVFSLRLEAGDLGRAADQWADEIAMFPRRV